MKIIGLADPEVESSLRDAGMACPSQKRVPLPRSWARPSLTELYCYDAMWSEHCSYKSSRATLKEFLPPMAPTW